MSDQGPSTTISSSKDEEQLSDILQSNLTISITTTPTTANPTDTSPTTTNQTNTATTVDDDDDDRWKPHDPATIDYGPFSSPNSSSSPSTSTSNNNDNDKFYLTTAINYTNGAAHIGHAYEICTSDSIVRYFRMKNSSQVRFCTGSDEHGQKNCECC